MEQERLWVLLGKKLAGAATKEELRELELLLLAYGEDAGTIEIIQRLWDSRKKKELFGGSEAIAGGCDPIRERIYSILKPSNSVLPISRRRWWVFGTAAACILLTLCLIAIRRSAGSEKEEKMLVLFTRKRSHSNLRFPDGTEVVLNENSRISYNAEFGKVKREIILEGEAYFDVAGNPAVPLVIHAENVEIRVLGTSFNVKAYPSGKGVETSLITGMVEISSRRFPGKKILLQPNEKITVTVSEMTLPEKIATTLPDKPDSNDAPGPTPERNKDPADTLSYHRQPIGVEASSKLIPEIAWMYSKLVFDHEPFESVAEKMEKWYGVTFHFEDVDVKREVFTGSFGKETLQEALRALQYSYPFDYAIKENGVFIRRKK